MKDTFSLYTVNDYHNKRPIPEEYRVAYPCHYGWYLFRTVQELTSYLYSTQITAKRRNRTTFEEFQDFILLSALYHYSFYLVEGLRHKDICRVLGNTSLVQKELGKRKLIRHNLMQE